MFPPEIVSPLKEGESLFLNDNFIKPIAKYCNEWVGENCGNCWFRLKGSTEEPGSIALAEHRDKNPTSPLVTPQAKAMTVIWGSGVNAVVKDMNHNRPKMGNFA